MDLPMKNPPEVFGLVVDGKTRCVHYHSELDIIAIKFKCCGKYYPCYQCHEESENHPIERWPEAEWNLKAILCGNCKSELTINTYRESESCPRCGGLFNPGCADHFGIYFEFPHKAV